MRWLALVLALAGGTAMAQDLVRDPGRDWSFLADTVMGGVSEGAAARQDGIVRLTGTVSTENRGGFIQVRTAVDGLPADARGLVLSVRGNGERYFVHLRTRGTRLPWQYYQAGFDTGPEWREIRLRWEDFTPSGRMLLRDVPRPEDIRSIGLVAFGRDHLANVSLRSLTIDAGPAAD